MFCSKCGAQMNPGAGFCPNCGQPAPAAAAPGIPIPAVTGSGAPIVAEAFPGGAAPVQYVAPLQPILAPRPYAGFWLRLVAYLIDSIVLTVILCILIGVGVLLVGFTYIRAATHNMNPEDPAFASMIFGWTMLLVAALLIPIWLYFAGMESSAHQGTLGKMALGLIVTDLNDQRISFGRATGRFFSKVIITGNTFTIGYIMAGFTEKKQALHDMIASTLVLRKI
jgi:uncharacterized RDD family membrane protein YckC